MGIWNFLQTQILGMKWLHDLTEHFLSRLGMDVSTRLGGSLHFFLYDIVKITILLCSLIFLISFIQSWFPPERSKKILGRFHGLAANTIAALKELNLEAEVEKIGDLIEIVKLGVLSAPSLMIDGKLVVSGKVASQKEIVKLLKKLC